MAVPLDMEFLSNFVQCSICLENFENPKMLKCGHQFCKECLEAVIEFKTDGSATILCPMRCDVQTVLGTEETLDALPASYEFKGILDALKGKDRGVTPQSRICKYDKSCSRDITIHCCETMMCKVCFVNHEKSSVQHHRKFDIFFSRRQNQLNISCEKHASRCTHLCVDGKFLCVYCLHRDAEHETHPRNTIAFNAHLIKQALVDDSKKTKDVQGFQKATEKNIVQMAERFDVLVEGRKAKCMSLYNDLLKKEAEIMKSKFQEICDHHMKQYLHVSPEYYEDTLGKCEIELAILKETILDAICKSTNKGSLDCITVSLSENFDFLSVNPLGVVQVNNDEKVSLNDTPVSTAKIGTSGGDVFSSPCDNAGRKLASHAQDSLQVAVSQTDDEKRAYVPPCATVPVRLPDEGFLTSTSCTTMENQPTSSTVQAYFDIEIGGESAGRIVMNLYQDIAPRTCRNFIQLCTHQKGYGYKGSKFHKVFNGLFFEAGDIILGNGTSGRSIYGGRFPCENFTLKHDDVGMLSMINRGNLTNDSQFAITLIPIPGWDGHEVAFGQVTHESFPVLQKMAGVEVLEGTSKPAEDIVIVTCGVMQ